MRHRQLMALGLCVGTLWACSPASPVAPDPGSVNIPGLPGPFDGEPTPTRTPVPRPTPIKTPLPTPLPFPIVTPEPDPFATPTPRPSVTPSPSGTPLDPATLTAAGKAFVAALTQKGLKPTASHLAAMRDSLTVTASGDWGTKGTLSPDETLTADFARYGSRFSPGISKEPTYLTRALAFASATGTFYVDTQFYREFGVPLVAKWDAASRQFILITADGAVTTYTVVASLPAARYLQVPADL